MTLRLLPLPIFALLSCTGGMGLEMTNPNVVGDDTGEIGIETDTDTDADADTDTDTDTDADADADTDTDTDTDLGPLDVDTIVPPYGTTAGGSEVEIAGGPFDSSARVWFGSNEATVVSASGNIVVAQTPSVPSQGDVTVRVRTDTREGSQTDAFSYFDDATGLAGTLGTISWYELVGGYWSSNSEWGDANVTFIEPAAIHYWELYTDNMDSCQTETFSTSESLYVWDMEASSISISSGSTSLSLPWDESSLSFAAELDAYQHISNGWYDLDSMYSSGIFDDLQMDNFFRAAQDLTVSMPAIQGNSPPNISRNQTIRWSGASADWILIFVAVTNASGTDFDSVIQCIAQNDGEFTIDGSLFSSWPTNRQVNVYVAAVKEQGGNLPYNNAESRVVGTYNLVGAGFSQ